MMKAKCPNCLISETVYRFKCNKFQIYFCRKCLNGFTSPVPTDLGPYYGDNYWLPEGFLGGFKDAIYRFFQIRRKYWVQRYLKKGEILDVGSGEGAFGKFFEKDFQVTSLDVPSANIQNPDVVKADFLKWNSGKRFDAIVFWESLEHTHFPQKYLEKAYGLLKKGGYVFIEYPNSKCFEARLFKNYWFHLDPPRHLSHLTPKGINVLLKRAGLVSISQYGVLAFEYTPGGLVSSILNLFVSHPDDFLKNSKNLLFIFFLLPVIFISVFIEVIFFIIEQSPIYLAVAQKR